MMTPIDVGFSNFLFGERILGVSRPDSSPIKRLIQKAKEEARYFDFTQGKKTRSIAIVEDGNSFILVASYIWPQTLINRLKRAEQIKETVTDDIVAISSEG